MSKFIKKVSKLFKSKQIDRFKISKNSEAKLKTEKGIVYRKAYFDISKCSEKDKRFALKVLLRFAQKKFEKRPFVFNINFGIR